MRNGEQELSCVRTRSSEDDILEWNSKIIYHSASLALLLWCKQIFIDIENDHHYNLATTGHADGECASAPAVLKRQGRRFCGRRKAEIFTKPLKGAQFFSAEDLAIPLAESVEVSSFVQTEGVFRFKDKKWGEIWKLLRQYERWSVISRISNLSWNRTTSICVLIAHIVYLI